MSEKLVYIRDIKRMLRADHNDNPLIRDFFGLIVERIEELPLYTADELRPNASLVSYYNPDLDGKDYYCSACWASGFRGRTTENFCWYCGADLRNGKKVIKHD